MDYIDPERRELLKKCGPLLAATAVTTASAVKPEVAEVEQYLKTGSRDIVPYNVPDSVPDQGLNPDEIDERILDRLYSTFPEKQVNQIDPKKYNLFLEFAVFEGGTLPKEGMEYVNQVLETESTNVVSLVHPQRYDRGFLDSYSTAEPLLNHFWETAPNSVTEVSVPFMVVPDDTTLLGPEPVTFFEDGDQDEISRYYGLTEFSEDNEPRTVIASEGNSQNLVFLNGLGLSLGVGYSHDDYSVMHPSVLYLERDIEPAYEPQTIETMRQNI